jgi:hypothetical protein
MPDSEKTDRLRTRKTNDADPVDSSRDEPFAYRDVSDQLPNEALREELAEMTEAEQRAYLRYLEELAERYLGPGGPLSRNWSLQTHRSQIDTKSSC